VGIDKNRQRYMEMFNGIRDGRMLYLDLFGYSALIVLSEVLILLGLIISSKNKLFQDPFYEWFIEQEV